MATSRTRRIWPLATGGQVSLQKREVSDYATGKPSGTFVRTKSGGAYLLVADFAEFHQWIEEETATCDAI